MQRAVHDERQDNSGAEPVWNDPGTECSFEKAADKRWEVAEE